MKDITAQVAVLHDRVESLKENDSRHFDSNEKRKAEYGEISLSMVTFQHIIEQNTRIMDGIASGMDELKKSVKELGETTPRIDTKFDSLNTRVERIENKLFNSAKMMIGLNELSKNKWFWFYLMVITLIIAGSLNPGILYELGALFKTIPKVK